MILSGLWQGNPQDLIITVATSMYQTSTILPGINKPTEPAIMIKVMKGDRIQLCTYSYYTGTVQPPGGVNPFSGLLDAIANSVIGNSAGKLGTGNYTAVSNAVNPGLTNFLGGQQQTNYCTFRNNNRGKRILICVCEQ